MTITGTGNFTSKAAALKYYGMTQGDVEMSDIDQKLKEGYIFIGKPETIAGEALVLLDGGTRYGIKKD